MSDHRNLINHVLGDDLSLRLFRQNDKMNQYVGLWSLWWSNSGDISTVRLIFATVPRTTDPAPPENAALKTLPWVVLQLQALSPDDHMWPLVYKTLHAEMDAKMRDMPSTQACPGKITYETLQSNTAKRQLVDPEMLQEYTIMRVDNPEDRPDPRPLEISNRKRVQYLVYRGRETDLREQPLQVFIEKLMSKRAPLSQRLHSETGLSKTTTLLSAVNDWHTWIVLSVNGGVEEGQ
jgi:hypothetical protein